MCLGVFQLPLFLNLVPHSSGSLCWWCVEAGTGEDEFWMGELHDWMSVSALWNYCLSPHGSVLRGSVDGFQLELADVQRSEERGRVVGLGWRQAETNGSEEKERRLGLGGRARE